jgi:hypothetical protein
VNPSACESKSLPAGTDQVASPAGAIVRSRALDLLVDHAEIVPAGESLQADGFTEEVSEPPEHDRAAERA